MQAPRRPTQTYRPHKMDIYIIPVWAGGAFCETNAPLILYFIEADFFANICIIFLFCGLTIGIVGNSE